MACNCGNSNIRHTGGTSGGGRRVRINHIPTAATPPASTNLLPPLNNVDPRTMTAERRRIESLRREAIRRSLGI